MKGLGGPGKRIGRWRLRSRMGPEPYSSTWRVTGAEGEEAILKLLPAPPGESLDALRRACHPAVVGVLDDGVSPVAYVVTEKAAGQSLKALLDARSEALELEGALALAAVLCDAVAVVHAVGGLHGDIKPANVVVASVSPPQLTLVDFGLGAALGAGTLGYAPPERLAGGGPSCPADIFALALVIWELVHGAPPWPELDLSEALMRRRQTAPTPERGPEWFRVLLAAMLSVDPAGRPTAAQAAEAFNQAGHQQLPTDETLLRRRAARLALPRPAAEAALRDWLETGGSLSLIGPPGSGRTRALRWLIEQLDGRPWLRLTAGGLPWCPVSEALASPLLSGPAEPVPADPDATLRGELAAAALADRAPSGLVLIADDVSELDAGSRSTLAALHRQGRIPVCVTGELPPPWQGRVCRLEPLDADELAELYIGIRGGAPPSQALVDRLRSASGGLPGPAVDLLAGVNRPGGDAALLGAALALSSAPLAAEALGVIADLDGPATRAGLAALESAGLAASERGRWWPDSPTARDLLAARCLDRVDLHRRLADWLLSQPTPQLVRVGLHLIGSRDADRAAALGPTILRLLLDRDCVVAAQLADDLWELTGARSLAVPRAEVLRHCGRGHEARTFLEGQLPDAFTAEELPLLISLAGLHLDAGDHRQATAWVERGRGLTRDEASLDALQAILAQAHLLAGRAREAAEAAATIAERPVPAEGDPALARWMTMRLLWARARTRTHSPESAIQLLSSIPPGSGRGRAERGRLEVERGLLLLSVGRSRDAGEVLADAAVRGAGLRPGERARTLLRAGSALYQTSERARAIGCWDEALALFERMNAHPEQIRTLLKLSLGYREAGRWERAVLAGEQAELLARDNGDVRSEVEAACSLADLYMARSEFGAAAEALRRAQDRVAAAGLREERVELARRHAELAVHQRTSDALRRSRDAHTLAQSELAPIASATAAVLVAVCEARQGHEVNLDVSIEAALSPLRRAGATRALHSARLWAAEAHVASGRMEDARAEANQVLIYAEDVWDVPLRNRAERILARTEQLTPSPTGRLDTLLDLAIRVARERDHLTLLDAIADAALDLLGGDRAFVLLVGDDGEPVVAAAQLRNELDTPRPPAMTIVRRALEGGRQIIASDLSERDDLGRGSQSAELLKLRSVMCVPMVDGLSKLGAIYVDSKGINQQELTDASRLMQGLAAHAAVAVTNARMFEESRQRTEQAIDVAHDMRKPAASIAMIAADLMDSLGDSEATSPLQDIQQLCHDILAMAQDHLEDRRPSTQRLDLRQLSERMVSLGSWQARQREVVVELAAGQPAMVDGDTGSLNRALSNLLSNAVRFTAPGSVVTVTVELSLESVVWRIRDRGPGIPRNMNTRIFDRGVSAGDGYGLGLSIARRIIEAHDGRITARNHPGGGALFEVTLPRAAD